MAEVKRFRLCGVLGSVQMQHAPKTGEWVRYSNHLADKASELERLAEEFEEKAQGTTELRDAARLHNHPTDAALHSVSGSAHQEDASRLRERSGELREDA